MAKEILIKFETDKDYDRFIEDVILEPLQEGKITFDQENNILIIKDLENGISNE